MSKKKKAVSKKLDLVLDEFMNVGDSIDELFTEIENNNKLIKVTFDKAESESIVSDKDFEELYKATELLLLQKLITDKFLDTEGPLHKLKKNSDSLFESIKKIASKKETIKRGAFLSKQLQKYNYPKSKQLDLFNSLEERTKDKILSSGVSIEFINRNGEALPLNKGHYKLIDCITELLHEKSVNKELYEGNEEGKIVAYGKDDNNKKMYAKAPALSLKLYEIAKKYNQNKYPSGRHIDMVKKLINDLAYNPEYLALIKYERKSKTDKNTILKKKIEEYAPLFRLLDTSYEEYNLEETKLLNKASEVVLLLNPVFTDQMENIWVGYPTNLVSRSLNAYGSSNPPEIYYRLRDYLADNRSRANYKVEIGKDRLYYLLAEKYMKSSRKTLIAKYLKTSLEAVIKIGLLKEWELKSAKSGGSKYVFYIEKEWV